jgi:hypothetical protein
LFLDDDENKIMISLSIPIVRCLLIIPHIIA